MPRVAMPHIVAGSPACALCWAMLMGKAKPAIEVLATPAGLDVS